MVRVTQVLERGADFQTDRSALALAGGLGAGFDVSTVRVGGSWVNVFGGVRALRSGGGDVVHAWGPRALLAAGMAGRGRIVYSPVEGSGVADVRWVRSIAGLRDVEVVVPTSTWHRAMLTRGVEARRCHMIRPGVDFGRVKRRRSPALRAKLGLAEDDYCLLAAGETTAKAGHEHAAWAAAILHELDPRWKLLLWGRGPRVARVTRFARRLGRSSVLRVAGAGYEFEELLPAADMVLVPARGSVATLPIAIAMAAGLPIVATVTYTVSELLEDHHTALMVRKGSPKVLAQRILELREDGRLQWAVSDMARTEAYEFFSMSRFLSQYRELYGQVARGGPVRLPEVAAGAGLRFHGRA